MNKIKDGDIVEILNLSPAQIQSIRGQQCNQKISPADIIGQRYYAKNAMVGTNEFIELVGWEWGGHFCGWFYPHQLRIVKKIK